MSILVNRETKVLMQGSEDELRGLYAKQMKEYGTAIAGLVIPGKGGRKLGGDFVFDTVKEAVDETGANCSCVFVSPAYAADAIMEAADSEMGLIVVTARGVPLKDVSKAKKYLEEKKSLMLGPDSYGVITPGECKVGLMPGYIYSGGNVGVVSQSSSLASEAAWHLTRRGVGQSTCLGLGADVIGGMKFVEVLELFERDIETQAVVMIGEAVSMGEAEAVKFIKEKMTKPVVGFVVGRTVPPARICYDAELISGKELGAEGRIDLLRQAGVVMVKSPDLISEAVVRAMGLK